MNTHTDPKPVARPVQDEKRWRQGAIVPACAEPSAETAYGCVEWFRYDKHESPAKGLSGSGKKQ